MFYSKFPPSPLVLKISAQISIIQQVSQASNLRIILYSSFSLPSGYQLWLTPKSKILSIPSPLLHSSTLLHFESRDTSIHIGSFIRFCFSLLLTWIFLVTTYQVFSPPGTLPYMLCSEPPLEMPIQQAEYIFLC